ncbi:MAG: L-seryl-tRNA(Sec) selenium transferase [Gemmatimonadaceae bacterium]|nr:L-seryl-tRNA(Sec) selenium transferase [Gemmatimonadaceae bacterium]
MTALRALPAVGSTLDRPSVRALCDKWPRTLVTEGIRTLIAAARNGAAVPQSDDDWRRALEQWLAARTASTLRPAINATGVILHTNLGRAPLAQAALDAIASIAAGAATVEYDVAAGARGSRHVHCAALLCELTGAEDAIVVNNCAAGLVLALQALAAGRETLVSRGELIEIGGSFRVPEIMAASGTTLVEVGTTNRTHVADYRRALAPSVAAIVKVHRSNFTVDGFVAEATVPELVPIAAEAGIPLIHDFGSGLMLDLAPHGLGGEPTAADALRDGASLVIMSGDKLLGGPQAGIVLGKRDAIAKLRQHPMARALRVDKLTLAALEATLALYREPAKALREIPTLAMLTAPVNEIEQRAVAIAAELRGDNISGTREHSLLGPDWNLKVERTESTVGGGAFPTARIPSVAITVSGDVSALEQRLRNHAVPVIAVTREGRLWLDLRSVPAQQDALLTERLREAIVG